MKAWLQRVSQASVTVDGETVSAIGQGLLVLLGVTHTDTEADARKIAGPTQSSGSPILLSGMLAAISALFSGSSGTMPTVIGVGVLVGPMALTITVGPRSLAPILVIMSTAPLVAP